MTGPLLDLERADDAHMAARLSAEHVAWLGSVRPDGRPHHVPVWFLWDDPRIYVFSGAGTQKLQNVRAHPHVTLHLDSADGGNDIVIVDGRAELVDDPALGATMPAFVRKYGGLMGDPDAWAAGFPQPILVTVTRVVGWTKTEDGLRYRVATPGSPPG